MRSRFASQCFPENVRSLIVPGVDAENTESLSSVVDTVRPDVVINCIGLVKQLPGVNNPLLTLPINSLLPHRR